MRLAPASDFGDAPASYGTAGTSHGAGGAILGSLRDDEAMAIVSADARGDDGSGSDDEDGVLVANLVAGNATSWTVHVTGGPARLDGWVDFDGNGIFANAERVTAPGGNVVQAGANVLPITVPAAAQAGTTYARFRLSSAGGLEPTGAAADGEVEDYRLTLFASSKFVFTTYRHGDPQVLDSTKAEIYAMNADGTGQTRLTNDNVFDDNANWSPDGTRIAFMKWPAFDADIYVMNADGSGQVPLTSGPAYDDLPDWSPDGSKILFRRFFINGNDEIYVMNADGSDLVNLSNNPANDLEAKWSPDGSKIVFRSNRDESDRSEIYVMNADGSNPVRLTDSVGFDLQPDWSPDGSKIAFVSERDGSEEIFVMNADGSGQTQLTHDAAGIDNFIPVWAPDGSKIAFDSTRVSPLGAFFVMNPDGSGQTQITHPLAHEVLGDWGGSLQPAAPAPDIVYVNPAYTVDGTIIADADPNTPDDQQAVVGFSAFDTIQEGVNAVTPGGTVQVSPGTFAEKVTLFKSVTLLGSGATATTLFGSGTGTGLTITGDRVSVAGLSVQNFFIGLQAKDSTSVDLADVQLFVNTHGGVINDIQTLNVSLNASDDPFVLAPGRFQRTGQNAIDYGGVSNLNLFGLAGADVFAVTGVPAGTVANIYTGEGDDKIGVTAHTQLGDVLRGPLSIDGGTGVNRLEVFETFSSNGDIVTLRADQMLGEGPLPFNIPFVATGGSYSLILLVLGGNADWVRVLGTPGSPVSIDTGAGNDAIHVTAVGSQLGATLGGPLSIEAGAGSNALEVNQAGSSNGDVIRVTDQQFLGQGPLPFVINYAATGGFGGGITLLTGVNDDWVIVQGKRQNSPFALNAGGGNDRVSVTVSTASRYSNLLADGDAGSDLLEIMDISGGAQFDISAAGIVFVTYGQGGQSDSVIDYLNFEGLSV